jgi:hypothetical protein
MTDKKLWEKSQVWESSDDGRGKLKILESVEKFADLIRADEREACAKIARKVANATRPDDFALDKCYEIEIAIRARGNT